MNENNSTVFVSQDSNVNKKKYSKEIVTSILGIMILILTLFSVSYAVFVKSFEGKIINTITTSNVILSTSNGNSNEISFVDLLPTTDDNGKLCVNGCQEIEFAVSNSSLKEMNYDIIVSDLSGNVDSKYLKVYLLDSNGMPLYDEVKLLSDFRVDGSLNEMIIHRSKASSLGKFKLRIWLSNDYVETNPVNFSFKMSVKGYI